MTKIDNKPEATVGSVRVALNSNDDEFLQEENAVYIEVINHKWAYDAVSPAEARQIAQALVEAADKFDALYRKTIRAGDYVHIVRNNYGLLTALDVTLGVGVIDGKLQVDFPFGHSEPLENFDPGIYTIEKVSKN